MIKLLLIFFDSSSIKFVVPASARQQCGQNEKWVQENKELMGSGHCEPIQRKLEKHLDRQSR
ncbi:MAG: hypothetical protein H0X26_07135 [Alphaproteobacteria bacterium]|nr:hypothetical protein [Alphaproteobacteria bacterium]